MLIKAINKELEMKKDEINQPLETIYFGGGTPSILSENELESIFNTISKNYSTSHIKEITLEAWVKTVRASKNFGFIEINDGSFFKNVQVVFNNDLSNVKIFKDLPKDDLDHI